MSVGASSSVLPQSVHTPPADATVVPLHCFHWTQLYLTWFYTGLYINPTQLSRLMAILDSTLHIITERLKCVCTRQNCPIAPSWHSKNTYVCIPVYLNGRHIPQTAPDIWTRRKAQPPLLAWGGKAENEFLAQADDQHLLPLPGSCTVVDHTPQWSLPLWSKGELPGLGTCSYSASLSPSSVRRSGYGLWLWIFGKQLWDIEYNAPSSCNPIFWSTFRHTVPTCMLTWVVLEHLMETRIPPILAASSVERWTNLTTKEHR